VARCVAQRRPVNLKPLCTHLLLVTDAAVMRSHNMFVQEDLIRDVSFLLSTVLWYQLTERLLDFAATDW
jgi:hypothetical protein